MDYSWLALLGLLLPVAYLSGWWIARRSAAENGQKKIPHEYYQGLNYVLNEQPDKAIEVFTRILEVDSETVETHLALGNLFRRRGEVDRAIRIHQNLIARPSLSRTQRIQALMELGMDYMRSGLLDRAENLFKELVDSGEYTTAAFKGLLQIYQQEKDWENAIVIARRLETNSGEPLAPVIAQFYCELALEQQSQGKDKEFRDILKRALTIHPGCVRASLMEARAAQKSGQLKTALRAYKRVEKQDPDFLPEIIRPLSECYRELGKLEEFMEYLRFVTHEYGGMTPLLCMAELIAELHGKDEAMQFIAVELRERPTILGVDKLLEYTIDKAHGDLQDQLLTIKELTSRLLESRTVYKCSRCGFDAKLLHWQCPSCKNWNTIKPVFGVEGE